MDQDEQTKQSTQAVEAAPVKNETGAVTTPSELPQKKKKIWPWILGGCLGIIIIGMLIIGGIAWWGAKKAKKLFQENQPKLEEIQKEAEKWQENSEEMQKAAEEWQKEMEKAQKEMPPLPSE